MPIELEFSAAFLVGMLGSSHCIGMCGGIISALGVGIDNGHSKKSSSRFGFHLSYNAGRIFSYLLIGLVAGFIGSAMAIMGNPFIARILAAVFMISLGLYLANWWRGLALLERWGYRIWRYIQPLSKRLLPVHNYRQAFMLGMLWGWLPCGLVYAVLVWALTTGNPVEAAILMTGFGLGTLPALLLVGKFSQDFAIRFRSSKFRATAGVIIMVFGFVALFMAIENRHHHVHTSASSTTLFETPESILVPAILRKLS
jgi:sulfite exporter TauE/SafE